MHGNRFRKKSFRRESAAGHVLRQIPMKYARSWRKLSSSTPKIFGVTYMFSRLDLQCKSDLDIKRDKKSMSNVKKVYGIYREQEWVLLKMKLTSKACNQER